MNFGYNLLRCAWWSSFFSDVPDDPSYVVKWIELEMMWLCSRRLQALTKDNAQIIGLFRWKHTTASLWRDARHVRGSVRVQNEFVFAAPLHYKNHFGKDELLRFWRKNVWTLKSSINKSKTTSTTDFKIFMKFESNNAKMCWIQRFQKFSQLRMKRYTRKLSCVFGVGGRARIFMSSC